MTKRLSLAIGALALIVVAIVVYSVLQPPLLPIIQALPSPLPSDSIRPTDNPIHFRVAAPSPSATPAPQLPQARNLAQTNSLPVTQTPNLLLRFTSPTARETFLAVNNLPHDTLMPLTELNVYALRATGITLTPGTESFTNHEYRASLTPTDPLTASQWYLSRINAPTAWDSQTGSANPVVAVIDTGFALNHEDLASAWASNQGELGITTNEGSVPNCTSRGLPLDKSCNNLDDDGDNLTDNVLGWNFVSNTNSVQAGQQNPAGNNVSHGTMTASLIAAATNNAKGGAGLNWQGRVLPLQALSDDGTGSTVTVALAVRYAVDKGVKIINMSLGGRDDDPLLAEQISYAVDQGVTVIASAGNDGCNCINYPAAYPNVIAVGATTSNNTRATFSNIGNPLSLVAPGTNICTAVWTVGQPTTGYGCASGTSFSAPIVAGAASLLLSQNPTLTRDQLKTVLTSTAQKLAAMNGANWTSSYGYGMLNIASALAAVSLPTPLGQPLSTRVINLSQAQSGPLAYLADGLNSNCISYVSDAVCKLRAIQVSTNQLVELSTNATNGLTDINWLAAEKLTPGQWLIQSYAVANGIQSLARSETLTINP